MKYQVLTLLLLNMICPVLANIVDPDHLASKKPTDLDLHFAIQSEFVSTIWIKQFDWLKIRSGRSI